MPGGATSPSRFLATRPSQRYAREGHFRALQGFAQHFLVLEDPRAEYPLKFTALVPQCKNFYLSDTSTSASAEARLSFVAHGRRCWIRQGRPTNPGGSTSSIHQDYAEPHSVWLYLAQLQATRAQNHFADLSGMRSDRANPLTAFPRSVMINPL